MRPMLSATLERLEDVKLPKLVSPKYDGRRAIIVDGVVYSKNMKPIPNPFVQDKLGGRPELNGLDGELIVGSPTFNKGRDTVLARSAQVTRKSGEPDFKFYVFDRALPDRDFGYRNESARNLCNRFPRYLTLVEQVPVQTLAQLKTQEAKYLKEGYEGIMLRGPWSYYKEGRATPKEDSLWKFKRFSDGEFRITGVEEGHRNENEATTSETGLSKRSTRKEGKVSNGLVGTILGVDLKTKKPIRCAPGTMTAAEREHFFKHPELLVDQIGHYRVFKYGAADKDRFPVWCGLRNDV